MNDTTNIPEMPVEEAMAQLDALVAGMESGKLPLENLLAEFERGSALVKLCRTKLDAMQRRIELLTGDDGKEGEWCNFEPDTPDRNGSRDGF